jgi:DNA processing protein
VRPPSRTLTGVSLPHRLADLPDPPAALYLHGELPRAPAVAIVGTRKATPQAVAFTKKLAASVAEAGIVVVSGGALGIDTAAHRGALSAKGITVVVAPAGLLAPYPRQNRALFASILDAGGAYLSLVPDAAAARTAAFFARNACLAALSEVLVVVEAPYRSGSRNAARWARKLGRPVLAVPSAPWNKHGAGAVLELRNGAGFCTSARDVFDTLERVLLHPVRRVSARPPEPPPLQTELSFNGVGRPPDTQSERERVCAAIASGATHLDAVCERTGLEARVVQKHVLTLTLEGALAPDPSGGLRLGPPSNLVSVAKPSKLHE